MSATVTLQEGREKSLRRQHPWVFDVAIATVEGRCRSGDTVDVVSADGQWLGRGAYSPNSQIRVRIWTFDQQEVVDNGFFLRRIEQAWTLRQRLMKYANTNACRLIAA